MKNLGIVFALGLLLGGSASAQQLGQYSQYVQNPFILNPAAAGIYDYTDISLSFRKQWAGLNDSPQTYYLSGHSLLKRKPKVRYYNPSIRGSFSSLEKETEVIQPKRKKGKLGVGGNVISDRSGVFQRNSLALAAAYHHPIGDKHYLSAGASFGLANYAFDRDGAILHDMNDQTYTNFLSQGPSFNYFDASAGLWFYSERFFGGYSAGQLPQNAVPLGNVASTNRQNIHHFLTAGYDMRINQDLSIRPSFMAKLMTPAPLSVDITAIVDYQKKYWGGLSYRQNDAAVAMIGLRIKELVRFGYSFEYTLSEIQMYNSGGHEIFVGIMLPK